MKNEREPPRAEQIWKWVPLQDLPFCHLLSSSFLKDRGILYELWWRNWLYEPPWGYSVFLTGWRWNNQRILQGFSWCEVSPKLILLWEFHCYHFPQWLMRSSCETTCCSRELLNSFIKANRTFFFLVLLVWWTEPGLRVRLVLELPGGLSVLKLTCSSQLWMAKPFWDVQWNCSFPLLWISNNISKALWYTSPWQGKQNIGVAEWILQTRLSSLVVISAVVSAMVVKNASCSGVQ